jgi:DNA-binding transcriptional MerR regulator
MSDRLKSTNPAAPASGKGRDAAASGRDVGRPSGSLGAEEAAGNGLLKISELAERSGVPVATVRHYLREGLLPEPVKTSRNMAYYPPEFVERIKVIKQLQEERFMPLRVIRGLLESGDAEPERLRAMIDLEDRILDRALAGERERIDADEVRSRYDVPQEVLDRLAELGVLTPDEQGYSPSDVRVVEAIGRFRAGGYDERIGFTVYDTLRYIRALEPLVAEEVDVLTKRLAGDVDPDRALEIIEAGIGPLNDLMAALHTKLLVARLRHDQAGHDRG